MRILAIDGGGIRGIYASHVLERIQDEFGLVFHQDFDLIAGTSTGAIIAAALAYDIPIAKITQLYREQGPLIFCPRRWSMGGALFPRYKSNPLRDALNNVFQDATLSDAKTRLIIPATDIGNGGVHVFKSAYDASFVRDRNVKVASSPDELKGNPGALVRTGHFSITLCSIEAIRRPMVRLNCADGHVSA